MLRGFVLFQLCLHYIGISYRYDSAYYTWSLDGSDFWLGTLGVDMAGKLLDRERQDALGRRFDGHWCREFIFPGTLCMYDDEWLDGIWDSRNEQPPSLC
jgi:hypothetical protein